MEPLGSAEDALLKELAETASAVVRDQEALEELVHKRDELLWRGRELGIKYVVLAETAGISQTRIGTILRRDRRRRTMQPRR